jgi:hypothetical protein
MDAWREIWVFRKEADGWTIRVLPPATTMPDIGYAEFAGWIPGGKQILVAREARGDGKYQRNFEVMRLDTLAIARQASDPSTLEAFQRWQDPSWKQQTLFTRRTFEQRALVPWRPLPRGSSAVHSSRASLEGFWKLLLPCQQPQETQLH